MYYTCQFILAFQILVEFSQYNTEIIYSSHTSTHHYHGESFELLLVLQWVAYQQSMVVHLQVSPTNNKWAYALTKRHTENLNTAYKDLNQLLEQKY